MNCEGTAPPTTFSANCTPEPRGSGVTMTSQTAYWPWPPDCLTNRPCPRASAVNVSRRADRSGHRVDLSARGAQPVEDDVGVRLAEAPQHELAGLDLPFDTHGRVARGEPGQRLREGVLVGSRRGLDGHRQQWFGHLPRLDQQRRAFRGDRVAGLGTAQPSDRADVARDGALDRAQRGAERGEDLPDALVGVVVGMPA